MIKLTDAQKAIEEMYKDNKRFKSENALMTAVHKEHKAEIKKLEEENEKLKAIIKYSHEICLCERFSTYGFDYDEKHPRKERDNGGSRPSTPRDFIENSCGFEWSEGGRHPKILTFNKILK